VSKFPFISPSCPHFFTLLLANAISIPFLWEGEKIIEWAVCGHSLAAGYICSCIPIVVMWCGGNAMAIITSVYSNSSSTIHIQLCINEGEIQRLVGCKKHNDDDHHHGVSLHPVFSTQTHQKSYRKGTLLGACDANSISRFYFIPFNTHQKIVTWLSHHHHRLELLLF